MSRDTGTARRSPRFIKIDRNLYELSKWLPKSQRPKFLAAVLAFRFDGADPEGLPSEAAELFELARPQLRKPRQQP